MEVRDYLWQILGATEYLHAHSILHLDLRSENMIITEPNLLKLLDFGNAQFYTQDKVITMDKCMDYVETMGEYKVQPQQTSTCMQSVVNRETTAAHPSKQSLPGAALQYQRGCRAHKDKVRGHSQHPSGWHPCVQGSQGFIAVRTHEGV